MRAMCRRTGERVFGKAGGVGLEQLPPGLPAMLSDGWTLYPCAHPPAQSAPTRPRTCLMLQRQGPVDVAPHGQKAAESCELGWVVRYQRQKGVDVVYGRKRSGPCFL